MTLVLSLMGWALCQHPVIVEFIGASNQGEFRPPKQLTWDVVGSAALAEFAGSLSRCQEAAGLGTMAGVKD